MKKALILSFCGWLGVAHTQTSLSGYVTLQNSEGKSAFPAQVKSFGASASDVSTDKGYFELIYDLKKPGQEVALDVIKDSYEVVNKEDLFLLLPRVEEKQRKPKIFLCPKGEWQRYADQYYQVNLTEINKTYEQKLAELQKKFKDATRENEDYREALTKLDEARKAAEAQAQDLAERFAKANLDDATDRYTNAHRLFTQGKIDSVLLYLGEEETMIALEKAKVEVEQGQEFIRIGRNKMVNGLEAKDKIIEEFMVKARAHIIKFQWEEAERTYDIAVKADSLNMKNLTEFAYFLYEQNKYSKALPIFEKCLSKTSTNSVRQILLWGLSGIKKFQNKYDEAIEFAKKSLELAKLLEPENPQKYQRNIAALVNLLGVLHKDKGDFSEALAYYKQTLNARQKIAQEITAPDNEDAVAETLHNMGSLYLKLKEYDNSDTAYKQALRIQRANTNTLGFEPVMKSLIGLGALNYERKKYTQSEKYFKEALEITALNCNSFPNSCLPFKANIQGHLSSLYENTGKIDLAIQYLNEATEILKPLSKRDYETYEPEVAGNLNNLGRIYANQQKFEKAIPYFLESLEKIRLLSNKNSIFLPRLRQTLYNVGVCHLQLGNLTESEATLMEAAYQAKSETELNLEQFEINMAEILNVLGDSFAIKNQLDRAYTIYAYPKMIYERHESKSNNLQFELCRLYGKFGSFWLTKLFQEGDTSAYNNGLYYLTLAEERLKKLPNNTYRQELGKWMNNLKIQYAQVDLAWLEQIKLIYPFEEKIKTEKDNVQIVKYQEEIINILELATKQHPNSFLLKERLASELGALSWYYLLSGSFSKAENAAHAALKISPAQNWINTNLALALLYQGKWEEAKIIYETWKGKPYDDTRSWTEVFLHDLKDLETGGIKPHRDVKKARAFLSKKD